MGADFIKKSKTLLFVDFTGVDTASILKLKTEIKKAGVTFRVIKKRLLKIALKNAGLEYDPTQFAAQVGTFFAKEDLSSFAGLVHKFAKDLVRAKKELKILGAYDVAIKAPITAEEFMVIAKLPTREVLLSMVLGGILGPLRAFMNIVDQLSKKPSSATAAKSEPIAGSAPAPSGATGA